MKDHFFLSAIKKLYSMLASWEIISKIIMNSLKKIFFFFYLKKLTRLSYCWKNFWMALISFWSGSVIEKFNDDIVIHCGKKALLGQFWGVKFILMIRAFFSKFLQLSLERVKGEEKEIFFSYLQWCSVKQVFCAIYGVRESIVDPRPKFRGTRIDAK